SMAVCWWRNQARVFSSTRAIPGFGNCRPGFQGHTGCSRTWCHWANELARQRAGRAFLAEGIRTGPITFCPGSGVALPLYPPVLVNRLHYLVPIATILA